MNTKRLLALFVGLLAVCLACAAALVLYVDPFFHYHAPHSDKFYYTIDNERSFNSGILEHFDYDAIITGTSMTANFRSSELDELFGTKTVKVPAAGATFYEIDMLINIALEKNPELKYVFRSIDRNQLFFGASELRSDLGEFPVYLYDDNIFNDYEYIFNADVLFGRAMPMLLETRQPGFQPGHTSFDDYSHTMKLYAGEFGLHDERGWSNYDPAYAAEPRHLSEEEKAALIQNIEQNVLATARANPDTEFYCFFPPYSLAFWYEKLNSGYIYRQLEAEEIAAEMMLECENIKLFDFSLRTDIISNVNNYRDNLHYGEWVNSLIFKWMRDGQYLVTRENYKENLAAQLEYYLSADYSALSEVERWHCDYYAAALLNNELTGAVPRKLSEDELLGAELRRAVVEADEDSGALTVKCSGVLGRNEEQDLGDYLLYHDYVGLKFRLEDAADYSYLIFKGRNTGHHGQPSAFAYNEKGEAIASMEMSYYDLQGGWQFFALDLRAAEGPVDIIINGAYTDYTGHSASSFEFKDFELY